MLRYTLETMSLSTDNPTVFNFRKDVIRDKIDSLQKTFSDQKEFLENVLILVKNELKELFKMGLTDPKSYEIWYHRLWIIRLFFETEQEVCNESQKSKQLVKEDLFLFEKYLKKDERNFHVWNYRLDLNKLLVESSKENKKEVEENQK